MPRSPMLDWTPSEAYIRESQAWQFVAQHDALGLVGRWRFRRRLKRAGWPSVDAMRCRCLAADMLAQGRQMVATARGEDA